ncbi:DUF6368 family protein [Dictyobacter alpinus]|uniref:DUF6368 family protein n=1 Tax=Dictyobacter alpinus TaxID=2014873 RepID=UPI003530AA7C
MQYIILISGDRRCTGSLLGRIFHMYYKTARDIPWIYHLVDPDFLRAWLQHLHFHMIK